MQALKDRALVIAKTQIGVQEQGRNRGPEVDGYLFAVGLPPGHAWCAAFVVWCYQQAARELGRASIPLRRTGKVTRLWDTACGRYGKRWPPAVGDIYCHANDIKDPDSPGHCGIVVSVNDDGTFMGVEGNTNRDGSREGDSVWRHTRGPGYPNLGLIDVAREITVKIRRPLG